MQVPGFLMNQVCDIKPYMDETPSGPLYGEMYKSKCRCEIESKVYKDEKGEEFVSNAILFLPPSIINMALGVKSEIVFDGKKYSIKFISPKRGFKISHIECVLI